MKSIDPIHLLLNLEFVPMEKRLELLTEIANQGPRAAEKIIVVLDESIFSRIGITREQQEEFRNAMYQYDGVDTFEMYLLTGI